MLKQGREWFARAFGQVATASPVVIRNPDKPTLRETQSLFAYHVAHLILEAYRQGYELTGGEWWRSLEEVARHAAAGTGSATSLHPDRLALDLNLFRNGVYLVDAEDHRPLGEWWEKQHPLARWGGRFGDGNHYSFTFGGRK